MGGGSESSANYSQSEIVFFGIDNIHAMRESLVCLRDYVDTHGANSCDGMSSFLCENESKVVLDAFFLGRALGEALNESLESVVGEFLSIVGQFLSEQKKQLLNSRA
ncbi:hypothetical protein CASFOL_006991 [Castilleja foliolosa]|uniref:Myotubularin phosphatase domain-containing protein n=1 Tax=Castilleja foliolosa TaxID=1961234 RepID=A0ABD3E810_9LAMI